MLDCVSGDADVGLAIARQHGVAAIGVAGTAWEVAAGHIDFDRLRLHTPEVVNDLPAGGKRLVQGAEGYEATLVAGTPVFERGEHTGAKPGRLVRRGR